MPSSGDAVVNNFGSLVNVVAVNKFVQITLLWQGEFYWRTKEEEYD